MENYWNSRDLIVLIETLPYNKLGQVYNSLTSWFHKLLISYKLNQIENKKQFWNPHPAENSNLWKALSHWLIYWLKNKLDQVAKSFKKTQYELAVLTCWFQKLISSWDYIQNVIWKLFWNPYKLNFRRTAKSLIYNNQLSPQSWPDQVYTDTFQITECNLSPDTRLWNQIRTRKWCWNLMKLKLLNLCYVNFIQTNNLTKLTPIDDSN